MVDVWEYLVEHYRKTGEMLIDLASDQTSCHNPYLGNSNENVCSLIVQIKSSYLFITGGYFPAGVKN